jgi:hypothetical protein
MEEGSATADKFVSQNADLEIRRKCDGDSNEIDESDLHERKQDEPRISTRYGITID